MARQRPLATGINCVHHKEEVYLKAKYAYRPRHHAHKLSTSELPYFCTTSFCDYHQRPHSLRWLLYTKILDIIIV